MWDYISGLHFEGAYTDGFVDIKYKNSAVARFSREGVCGDTPAHILLHRIRHYHIDTNLWEHVDIDVSSTISE